MPSELLSEKDQANAFFSMEFYEILVGRVQDKRIICNNVFGCSWA